MKKITIIVAVSENFVIGIDNKLPWHISEDLKNFKKVTLNHSVIMGRKTFQSIGKPLIERRNIVITRDKALKISGVEVVTNLNDAIDLTNDEKEIFIIGGEQIYNIAMPLATNMIVTKVLTEIKGDAFFPIFNENQWEIISQKNSETEDGLKYSFINYQKLK